MRSTSSTSIPTSAVVVSLASRSTRSRSWSDSAGVSELWADASLLSAPVFEHLGYAVVERYVKERGAVSFPNTWLMKTLR